MEVRALPSNIQDYTPNLLKVKYLLTFFREYIHHINLLGYRKKVGGTN